MQHFSRAVWLGVPLLLLAGAHCGGNDCDQRPEMVIQSGDAPLLPDGGYDCSACTDAGFPVQVFGCNPVTVEGLPAVACLESAMCSRGPPPGSFF
jgi:hypothetical protein